jgi:hypothetical protein
MSLINKILPGCNVAAGETKSWSSAQEGGLIGSRVTANLDEDGILHIDVVEWVGSDYSPVMSIALSPDGEVLSLEGISRDEIAPVSEFSVRLRSLVADMEEVA